MTDIATLCHLVLTTHRMREKSWDGRMYILCHYTCAEQVCHDHRIDDSGVVDLVAALAATGQGHDAASHYLSSRKTITAAAVS